MAAESIKENAWQMPQGGINPGESPRHAALRELAEEIGTNNVEVLAETQSWLHYDLPENMVGRAWNGRWIGQRQKWFIMRYLGADSAINIAKGDPEFNDWRWVPPCELPQLAVSFKRQVYVSLLVEFEKLVGSVNLTNTDWRFGNQLQCQCSQLKSIGRLDD